MLPQRNHYLPLHVHHIAYNNDRLSKQMRDLVVIATRLISSSLEVRRSEQKNQEQGQIWQHWPQPYNNDKIKRTRLIVRPSGEKYRGICIDNKRKMEVSEHRHIGTPKLRGCDLGIMRKDMNEKGCGTDRRRRNLAVGTHAVETHTHTI